MSKSQLKRLAAQLPEFKVLQELYLDSIAKIQYLVDNVCEGDYTFSDGDTWEYTKDKHE